MITAHAYLDTIRANGAALQHDWDDSRVEAIVSHLRAHDLVWDLQPILVVEDAEPIILDGHHRYLAAQRLGFDRIPAWVVPAADYARIIDAHCDGYAPSRISDLDSWIDCGGQRYSDLGMRR